MIFLHEFGFVANSSNNNGTLHSALGLVNGWRA